MRFCPHILHLIFPVSESNCAQPASAARAGSCKYSDALKDQLYDTRAWSVEPQHEAHFVTVEAKGNLSSPFFTAEKDEGSLP